MTADRSHEQRSVAVVGGGPGGLIAAERLAMAGMAVTLFEQMPSVGRKFLLAGRGGLNITHGEPMDRLVGRYGDAAEWLAPAIAAFGPADLRAWCESLGEPTFVGSSGRVFPVSFRATSLLRAWLERLERLGVVIRTRHRWIGWGAGPNLSIRLVDGSDVLDSPFDAVVIALGGASWPHMGSDGLWVQRLRDEGLSVSDLRPANCGLTVDWSPAFVERFARSPLKNVRFDVEGSSSRGEAVVTETGLEGGGVYAVGAAIRDKIAVEGTAVLLVDLLPDVSLEGVGTRLDRRRPKDSMSTMLGRHGGLSPISVALVREATNNLLPSSNSDLAALLKAVPLQVTGTESVDRAISSAGGVERSELDDHFMLRSRPGVFVAGEMLDWEAPTGGYLLQATFSTGVAAADGVVAWLGRQPNQVR